MAAKASTCAGLCLVFIAGHASAQTADLPAQRAGDSQAASSTAPSAITTLSPLLVQGQLQTELPPGATMTTRSQLDDRSIESWEDFARRGEPGVNYSRDSESVNIRGQDGDRVVTRVDGIRIPWLDDGARGERGGLATINFNTLSSVDLVRAAGGVQSGSLVGYVDLRTLSSSDLLRPGRDFGALVKGSADTADDSRGIDAALAGRVGQGDTSWLVQAGYRRGHELENMGDMDGLGSDRDAADPLRFIQRNILVKLQHDLNQEHRIGLSAEAFELESNSQRLFEQGPDTSYYAGQHSASEKQSRERAILSYDFQSAASKSAVQAGEVKVYWQRSKLDGSTDGLRKPDPRGDIMFGPFPAGQVYGYAYPYGPYGRSNTVKETGYGALTSWNGYLDAGAVQHHWAAGAEWYHNRNEQASSGYDNCPAFLLPNPPMGPRSCEFLHTNQSDMPEARGHQWSAWAQDEISWEQGRYALTPALRYDAYRQSPQGGGDYSANPNAGVTNLSSNSGHRLSPSILATYAPRDTLSFYARYGYGYKAPSATQLYMNYGAPGTYLRVGNPELKAEVSHGYELGVDAGDADLGGHFSFFDNRYRDYIDAVPLAPGSDQWNPAWDGQYPFGVTANINRARVRIYGMELSGHWNIDENWFTWGSLAWTHGRDLNEDRYLNSVAPLKAILALGYRTQQWGAQAMTTLVKARSQVAYPDPDPAVNKPDFQAPGYGVVDLTAWWTPPAIKSLRVQAGMYNVFDKKYWNALDVPTNYARPIDWYTQPGRSLRLSVSYQY